MSDDICPECGEFWMTDGGPRTHCPSCGYELDWHQAERLRKELDDCHTAACKELNEKDAKIDRLQELLDSTSAQLKRTQDERDKYMAQLAKVKAWRDEHELGIKAEKDAGILEPEWCRAHLIMLDELKKQLDTDMECVVLDAKYMGENTYGEFRYKDGYKVVIKQRLPGDVKVRVLVTRAGGTVGAAHQDQSPEKETP